MGGPVTSHGHSVKLDSVPAGYTVKTDERGTLGNVTRTPQGGIQVPARLTRSGVFEYHLPGGKVQREYRSPEEVAKAGFLSTLEASPVLDNHPYQEAQGLVTPENFGRLNKGHATAPKLDAEGYVSATLYIQDAALIAKIDSGKAREISCGILSKDIHLPGKTPQGEPYDVLQTELRANHVAIVPTGRMGPGARIKLDSAGLPALEETPEEKVTPMRKIKIDGVDFPLGTEAEQIAAVQAMDRLQAKLDAEAATKKAELETLKGKLDAANAEVSGLKTKLDAATDPKALEAAVAAKAALRETATAILGKEEVAKLDSDLAIKLAVVGKVYPGVKLDAAGATARPDYLAGLFDSATAKAKLDGNPATSEVIAHLNTPAPAAKLDSNGKPELTPAQAWERDAKAMGSQPLAFSKK
jgi:hypothetical protein